MRDIMFIGCGENAKISSALRSSWCVSARLASPGPPAVALVVEKPAEADSSYQPFDDDMVGNDSCVSVVVTTCQS